MSASKTRYFWALWMCVFAVVPIFGLVATGALAWNSGVEDKPGPDQARAILKPWDGEEGSALFWTRNEHGFLLKRTFLSIGDPELEVMADEVIDFPVWARDRSFVNLGLQPSVLPSVPVLAEVEIVRKLNLSGLAGLPDHSFSLWDWASGNESCPLGAGGSSSERPNFSDVQACHQLASHLGATNSHHFSPQAGDMYTWYHGLALEGAQYCKNLESKLLSSHLATYNKVYLSTFSKQCRIYVLALEAFGQHFLQDVWAVGHMWNRWGAPDLEQFGSPTSTNLERFNEARMIALGAGLIHGSENVPPFTPDAMSSGVGPGYLDPDESTPVSGVGDGRVNELFENDSRYLWQRTKLEACTRASVAKVWEALGGSAKPYVRINPIGPSCLGPRNVYSAIYRGIGKDFMRDSLVEWIAKSSIDLDLSPATQNRYKKDFIAFAEIMKVRGVSVDSYKTVPNWANLPLSILSVATNEQYRAPDSPPAPFADPRTLTPASTPPSTNIASTQGLSLTDSVGVDEPIKTDRILKSLFNKAHLKVLCTDEEYDPFKLKARIATLLKSVKPEDKAAIPVANEICTEFTARHLQFPTGKSSMCQLVGADEKYTIADFVWSGSLGELGTPLQAAATEWCAPVKLTVEKLDLATNSALTSNQGLVSSSSGEINCGDNCEAYVGSQVTLTAENAGGWVFNNWADDSEVCAGETTNPCIVTMDSDKIAKAVFAPRSCLTHIYDSRSWQVECSDGHIEYLGNYWGPWEFKITDRPSTGNHPRYGREWILQVDGDWSSAITINSELSSRALRYTRVPALDGSYQDAIDTDINWGAFIGEIATKRNKIVTQYTDLANWHKESHRCVFNGDGTFNYGYYSTQTSVDGVVTGSGNSNIANGSVCASPADFESTHSVTVQDSIINRCLMDGFNRNNCPLENYSN